MAVYISKVNSVSVIYSSSINSFIINMQTSKINSYKAVNGDAQSLMPLEVVHYHIDRGYSVPILCNWFRNPHYITSEITKEGGSIFQVFMSLSVKMINTASEMDILVFKIADNNTYMVEMSTLEMMFADRCAQR